jgi:hypothetical protein
MTGMNPVSECTDVTLRDYVLISDDDLLAAILRPAYPFGLDVLPTSIWKRKACKPMAWPGAIVPDSFERCLGIREYRRRSRGPAAHASAWSLAALRPTQMA